MQSCWFRARGVPGETAAVVQWGEWAENQTHGTQGGDRRGPEGPSSEVFHGASLSHKIRCKFAISTADF